MRIVIEQTSNGVRVLADDDPLMSESGLREVAAAIGHWRRLDLTIVNNRVRVELAQTPRLGV